MAKERTFKQEVEHFLEVVEVEVAEKEYRNNVNTNLIPLIINNYGSKFTSDKCGTND